MSNEKIVEPVNFTIIDAVNNEEGGSIVLTAYSDEIGHGGEFVAYYKKYDRASKEFVDDAEQAKVADELLVEATGVHLATAVKDLSKLVGATIEGYYSAERGRIYTNPPKEYVEYAPIDAAAKAAIKKLQFPVMSSPVTDNCHYGNSKDGNFYSIHRLEFGIPVEVDGEVKVYRVSQIARTTGRAISLKYNGSFSGGFTTEGFTPGSEVKQSNADHALESLFSGEFDDNPELAAIKEKSALDELTRGRVARLAEIENECGYDILENGTDGIEITDVDVVNTPSGTSMYIIATIAKK